MRQVHARTSRRVSAAEVRDAVDRVLGALPDEAPVPAAAMVVLTASSMPDLASRLRTALGSRAPWHESAVATEGRHTVVVARVAASDVDVCAATAASIGAQCTRRDV